VAHSFTVQLNDDISSVLEKVESQITNIGGCFQGNAERGSFDGESLLGLIKGEYCSLSDNEIRITIKHKPFLVPYSMIESEIKKYFT
jgi:hypothetical protein